MAKRKERMVLEQESFFDCKERDRRARELRNQGLKVYCSTFRNQQTWDIGMVSFGLPREQRPGFRVGSVYMLTAVDRPERIGECDWCGAAITPEDSEDGLCARCARIAQEQDGEEFERPEFPVYVGSNGQEHAEF